MNRIQNIITNRKEELFKLLSDLIKIDSQSSDKDGNEKEIALFIADYIKSMGIEPDVYCPLDVENMKNHPDYLKSHKLDGRYNVSAVIPGRDRTRRLMLAAHSDTVGTGSTDEWSVDPFSGIIKDGKIWGRGACDDKYAIASVLFLIRVFREEKIEFPMDIVFTAYCNEEYGGSHGALAACLRYPCDEIINLDCKNFQIWTCAIGGGEMKLHIKSKKTVPDCEIMYEGLRAVIEEFGEFRKRREAELRSEKEYKDSEFVDECVKFLEIKAGNAGVNLDCAHVEVCYYATSDENAINREFDEMTKRLNENLVHLGIEVDRIEKTTRFFHFEKTAENNSMVEALVNAAKNSTGRILEGVGACQSDLSMFLRYGSPKAISFGIGRAFGVYGGAHQVDEHIECDSLLEFAKILAELLSSELK